MINRNHVGSPIDIPNERESQHEPRRVAKASEQYFSMKRVGGNQSTGLLE